jgi:hypothetical protein
LSLAPQFKFITQLEQAGIDCPDVLSIAQVLRAFALFALLGLAIAVLSLPSLLGA